MPITDTLEEVFIRKGRPVREMERITHTYVR
jgi:hypothetical protein